MKRPAHNEVMEFGGMISVSPQMKEFFVLLSRVARTDATVLIRGETGTGKELVARALHDLSARKSGPFRAINCATLTGELLASELFGHVRGAFTGAFKDKKGLFAAADHGTIFLDEIAELPLELQSRLLRVLQERSFVPVGGLESVPVDVRLVSATHRALREEVEHRRFREDLMYRVRVAALFLPPLRERTGDVDALTWHFVDELNAVGTRVVDEIQDEAMSAMRAYAWPGNVRELRNNLEHAYALGEGSVLRLEELTPELRGIPASTGSLVEPNERSRLTAALAEAKGHRGRAAEILGVSRTTLWRKLREHRLG